jgi:hypothetical protein
LNANLISVETVVLFLVTLFLLAAIIAIIVLVFFRR